jgi:hypothetical protein
VCSAAAGTVSLLVCTTRHRPEFWECVRRRELSPIPPVERFSERDEVTGLMADDGEDGE